MEVDMEVAHTIPIIIGTDHTIVTVMDHKVQSAKQRGLLLVLYAEFFVALHLQYLFAKTHAKMEKILKKLKPNFKG